MSRRHPNVVHVEEVEPNPSFGSGKIRSSVSRSLGRAAGGREVGCTYYEVAPGKTAFPHHWHSAVEEAAIIIEGEGRLRIGDAEVAVRAGDYIAFPCGPEGAHQLWNTGDGPLRYYCVSTIRNAEVCGYPDSRKYGLLARLPNGQMLRQVVYEEDSRGYYDREEAAKEE